MSMPASLAYEAKPLQTAGKQVSWCNFGMEITMEHNLKNNMKMERMPWVMYFFSSLPTSIHIPSRIRKPQKDSS